MSAKYIDWDDDNEDTLMYHGDTDFEWDDDEYEDDYERMQEEAYSDWIEKFNKR